MYIMQLLFYSYYWKSGQLNILNFSCNREDFCANKSIPLAFIVRLYDFGFQQYATRSGGDHSWRKREAKFSQLQCKSTCWISHKHRHNQNSGTLVIRRAAWVLIVVVGITCIFLYRNVILTPTLHSNSTENLETFFFLKYYNLVISSILTVIMYCSESSSSESRNVLWPKTYQYPFDLWYRWAIWRSRGVAATKLPSWNSHLVTHTQERAVWRNVK